MVPLGVLVANGRTAYSYNRCSAKHEVVSKERNSSSSRMDSSLNTKSVRRQAHQTSWVSDVWSTAVRPANARPLCAMRVPPPNMHWKSFCLYTYIEHYGTGTLQAYPWQKHPKHIRKIHYLYTFLYIGECCASDSTNHYWQLMRIRMGIAAIAILMHWLL